jgi:uncharacterized Ntn-hydrolase superfamily protein
MTFSIVARDAETGAFGVGVETHRPSVGGIVPWVKPGVGAIATQSFANINFGPQGLALLEEGLPAERTLAALIAGDDLPTRRQVAVLDETGTPAVHTGDDCIPFAGHVIGEGYSCQANMMLNAGVPEAMAAAFERATGHLAERIMSALEAAQAAGGDIRGMMSAAILVREPGPRSPTWDLRIDNSPRPLEELRALLNVRLAGIMVSDEHIKPEMSLEEAMAAFERAAVLDPNDELRFWFGVNMLTGMGHVDEAVRLLEPLFERAPNWAELLRRLTLPGAKVLQPRFGMT